MEILGGIAFLTIMILLSGIKIVKEHNQLVVFRLGKVLNSKGPGMHMVIPIIDQVQTIDTRIVTLATPLLEEMTLDKVSVRISAVCLFQIIDAKKMVIRIDDVTKAVNELLLAGLRMQVSQHDLKSLVSERGRMNDFLKSKLEKQTQQWGVRVNALEIKEVKIPREMKKELLRVKRRLCDHPDHHPDHH